MIIAQLIATVFGKIAASTPQISTTILTVLDAYKLNSVLFLTAESGGTGSFIDDSSNKLTVTAGGTPGQGVVSPYYAPGYYSNYFNGSTDYLTIPTSVPLQFGTGNFTVECWTYLISRTSTYPTIFSNYNSYTSGNLVLFAGHANNTAVYQFAINATFIQTTTSIIYNSWAHLALVRSGSTTTLYINGVASGNTESSAAINGVGSNWYISAAGDNTSVTQINGYISNFRVVKGTALYTSSFILSTTPLQNIPGTSLLTCQSNRFIDNSVLSSTLTVAGSPRTSSFGPFAEIKSIIDPTVSGLKSVFFNGTASTLTATIPAIGNNMFTFEFWYYLFSAPAATPAIFSVGAAEGANTTMLVWMNTARTITLYSTSQLITTTATVPLTTWAHIAIVRNSTGNATIYINGVASTSAAMSRNLTNTSFQINKGWGSAATGQICYVSNFRFLNNIALYTGAFIPPTTELTAITGTSLLTCIGNSISDISTNLLSLTLAGAPQIKNFSPFDATPGANIIANAYNSTYFSGSTNYLTVASNAALDLSSTDATIECWIYLTTLSNAFQIFGTNNGSADGKWLGIFHNTANGLLRGGPAAGGPNSWTTAAGAVAINTWTHIAYVLSGTAMYLYINGTRVVTSTKASSYAYNSGSPLIIGRLDGNNTFCFPGYISNFRIVKTALYTGSSFTPSTTPLTAITNTALLTLSGNNQLNDLSTNALSVAIGAGSPRAQLVGPFAADSIIPGYYGSMYFNGSTDYLSAANSTGMQFGASSFTVELWINTTSTTRYATIMTRTANASSWEYTFMINHSSASAGDVAVYIGVVSTSAPVLLTTGAKVNDGMWHHIAWVRSGSSYYLFVDGVQRATALNAGTVASLTVPTIIGTDTSFGGRFLSGYISNLRVIKGTAVYTAAFTPSTAPLTAITNTVLLTCAAATSVGVTTPLAQNTVVVTATGTPTFTAFGPFTSYTPLALGVYGGSMYFNGTTDYLTVPSNTALELSADYTVEMWVYPINWSGSSVSLTSGSVANALQFGQYGSASNLGVAAQGQVWVITDAALPAVRSWSHVALTRSGTATKIFINGSQSGSTISNATSFAAITTIGQMSGAYFNGYISNLRIIKGSAVYTTNFILPTQPVTAIANTTLLLNANNTELIDATGNNDIVPSTSSSMVSTAQSKFGSKSIYLNGSRTLTVPANAVFNAGTGAFTIECWVYPETISASYPTILGSRDGWSAGAWALRFNNTGQANKFSFHANGFGDPFISSSSTFSFNQWHHVALTRSGNTFTLWVNGTSQATGTSATALNLSYNTGIVIGQSPWDGAAGYYKGYIDDLRITTGVARYVANFTPVDITTNINDIYLSSTQLYLRGDAGVLTNTFADSSANNFTVTKYGTPGQGTFTPSAVGYYSTYFNGTSDYLSISDNTAFNFGTGDATVEFWFNSPGTSNSYPGIISSVDYNVAGSSSIRFDNTGYKGKAFMYINGGGDPVISSTSTITYNTWNHIAIVRQGTSLKLYLNGTLNTSVTISVSLGWYLSASGMRIGRGFDVDGAGGYYPGYLSNIRLVKGTAVYTGNFTPPTTPLTAVSGTSLLACYDGTMMVNQTPGSTSTTMMTVSGTPRTTSWSPFVKAFDNTMAGSYHFGSGNYLSVNAQTALSFGTGDFTIECWVYPTAVNTSYGTVIEARSASAAQPWLCGLRTSAGVYKADFYNGTIYMGGSTIPTNTWTHISWMRKTGVLSIVVNGVLDTSWTGITGAINASAATQYIGTLYDGVATSMLGYISNLRVVKGTALYISTTNSASPTTELAIAGDTYAANTVLLLNGAPTSSASTSISDSSPNPLAITLGGTPSINSASPFGGANAIGGSIYFDGANDNLRLNSANLQIGTGDFTVECWVYPTAVAGAPTFTESRTSGSNAGFNFGLASGALSFYSGSRILSGGTPIPNTWSHIAVTRSGTTLRMFLNGALRDSATNSTNFSNQVWYIGSKYDSSNEFRGYMSNLRIVKGTAVYTDVFTPSTTPLTAVTNTVLLLNNISTSFSVIDSSNSNTSLVAIGDAKVTTAAAKFGSGSIAFDGSGDGITVSSSTAFAFGSSNFTVEMWVYLNTIAPQYQVLIDPRTAEPSVTTYISLTYGVPTLRVNGVDSIAGSALSTGVWYHLAVCRISSETKMYINGSQVGNTYIDLNTYTSSSTPKIGIAYDGTSSSFSGYIDDLRVTKDVGRYSSGRSLIPSTAALTTTSQGATAAITSLLLTAQNSNLIDSTIKNNFTVVGNVTSSTSTVKAGATSMYFDGSSYAFVNGQPNHFSSGDFTVELWVYFTTVAADKVFVDYRPSSTQGAYVTLWVNASSQFTYYTNSNAQIIGPVPIANTWYHVAVVRLGTSTKMYINGRQVESTYTNSAVYLSGVNRPVIGGDGYSISAKLTGYIDDFRVSNVARYTNNFYTGPYTASALQSTVSVVANASLVYLKLSNPITFTITTTNLADGTILNWTNTGTSVGSYFTDGFNAGSVTVVNNTATVIRTTLASTSASASTLILSISNLSGTVLATASTISLSSDALPTSVSATYLIVAGGGGGGGVGNAAGLAGGGGAGGLLSGTLSMAIGTIYAISVGAGGTGTTGSGKGGNGTNSVLSTFTAIGGGGGAAGRDVSISATSGGSGGGGGGGGGGSGQTGASGTVGQGNRGGNGETGGQNYGGAGGGGAGSAGSNGTTLSGGNGGAGVASSITGSSVTYAGGGGGGINTFNPGRPAGTGGAGGGGAGGANAGGTAGTANTGGGGGGAGGDSANNGAAGGSGIVIVSYSGGRVFNGGTITLVGGNTIHTFTTSGSLA